MNAVAAVFGADPPESRAAVARMLDRMARAQGQRLIVAHALGAIGAAGRAPASAGMEDGTMLAGDIRLSNRAEVRAALGLDARVDDARLAVEAFAKSGAEFARQLVGEFALVILDPSGGRLLAVRDSLGMRPLYYRIDGRGVRLASELRALVEPGDEADEGYLAEALAGDVVDLQGTPYRSIKRVPAAHVLVASMSGTRLVRYWEPHPAVLEGRPAEHAERFREAFDESVRACCDGIDRVGVHLSGGLDSSSVLGTVMANTLAAPVTASLVLPWPESDERAWIAAAAAHWSLTPILVEPPSAPAAHGLSAIPEHRDLPDPPSFGPLLAPMHQALHAAGVDVVLTGLGGDQWWSGESAHMADLLRRGDLRALLAWKRAGGAMGESEWNWRSFVQNGMLPLVPARARRLARARVPARPPAWIERAFAARVDLMGRLRNRPPTPDAPSESWRRLRWRLDSGQEALVKERLDRMAVAHGVELRHPMYDRRLVELALATPDDARIADGRNRVVFRNAMADRLSPATFARSTKADLSPLLLAGARAADVERHLSLRRLTALGWIDTRAAASIVARARAGDLNAALPVWDLIGVEAWFDEIFGAE